MDGKSISDNVDVERRLNIILQENVNRFTVHVVRFNTHENSDQYRFKLKEHYCKLLPNNKESDSENAFQPAREFYQARIVECIEEKTNSFERFAHSHFDFVLWLLEQPELVENLEKAIPAIMSAGRMQGGPDFALRLLEYPRLLENLSSEYISWVSKMQPAYLLNLLKNPRLLEDKLGVEKLPGILEALSRRLSDLVDDANKHTPASSEGKEIKELREVTLRHLYTYNALERISNWINGRKPPKEQAVFSEKCFNEIKEAKTLPDLQKAIGSERDKVLEQKGNSRVLAATIFRKLASHNTPPCLKHLDACQTRVERSLSPPINRKFGL